MKVRACIFNIQKFSLHDGPGIRTVVFFKGCPLRCTWCANPESQLAQTEKMYDQQKEQFVTVGETKTVAQIMEVVLQDRDFYEESGGGVTLSGGEVLFQADFALELLQALKAENIHTTCETTGFCKPATFLKIIDYVDLVYFDLKHYDEARHQAGTGVKNQMILANLKQALASLAKVIVRIPVIPHFNAELTDARHFAALCKQLNVEQIELLPFHQFGEEKYQSLDREYTYQAVPQLHTEDLTHYQQVFIDAGLACLVR